MSSLTLENLQRLDRNSTVRNAPGNSSSVQGTTCSTKRQADSSIRSILGFGGLACADKTVAGAAAETASTQVIAVGRGSVRPPPSHASRRSSHDADDMLLESLEAQLEEERNGRRAMEEKIDRIASLLDSISVQPNGAHSRPSSGQRQHRSNTPTRVPLIGIVVGTNNQRPLNSSAGKPPMARRQPSR